MFQPEKDFEEYGMFVFKYLMSLCGNADLAEELTQETFYRAIRSSGKFDGNCKVSTWLCQIAKHIWYQELDRRRSRKRGITPVAGDNVTLSADGTMIDEILPRKNVFMMETARFPHGFAKLRSISGIKNWIGEGERKPNRCRKTERGMAWKMIIAGKNRRWK